MRAYGMDVEAKICPQCGQEMQLSCIGGNCFWVCNTHHGRVGEAPALHQVDGELKIALTEHGWIKNK